MIAYKEFDVVKLKKTNQEATIIEVYKDGGYLVEVLLENGDYETYDVKTEDIYHTTYR